MSERIIRINPLPNKSMIKDFRTRFNTYDENNYNFETLLPFKCPRCGAKGRFTRHATYNRYLVTLINHCLCEIKLTILRVKCGSCDATHAIIPADIVPYKLLSLSAIEFLFSEVYLKGKTIISACESHKISYQLFYQYYSYIHLFFNFIFSWLNSLSLIKSEQKFSSRDLLVVILKDLHSQDPSYFDFCKKLLFMTKFQNNLPPPIYIGVHSSPICPPT